MGVCAKGCVCVCTKGVCVCTMSGHKGYVQPTFHPLHPLQTWHFMPRNGFQVIRGPGPPSIRWPSAKSFVPGTMPKSIPPRGRWRQERPRVTPKEVWESAKKRVLGLEAAIFAMIANGIDETSSEVTSLKLWQRRSDILNSPVYRSKVAMEFIKRVRKRLAATTPKVQWWRRSWSTAKPGQ